MTKRKLKPGWQWVKFGDVVRQVKDRVDPTTCGLTRYIAGEHMDTDDLRLRRWGEIGDGYLGPAFHMRFRPGQVLYGSRRTYLRKVAVADFEGICANTTYVLESKDPKILLPELLPFIMQTEAFNEHSIKQSKGSVNPYTNFSDLEWCEFALPSLEEQRRIADLLSEARRTTESLDTLVVRTELLWVSAAAELFSETGNTFSKEHNEKRLGSLLVYASDGPFGSKLKTEHYSDSGARVIRLQNIQRLYFDGTDKAFITAEYYRGELSGYTVNPGDVLIAGLGDDSIQAGRACVAPDDLGPAINKADCYCLRPGEQLNAAYLVAFLNSPFGLRQSMSFSQGTTRYRLNLGNIKRMKVPVPQPNIQREIANALNEIHAGEKTARERLADHKSLTKTLVSALLEAR